MVEWLDERAWIGFRLRAFGKCRLVCRSSEQMTNQPDQLGCEQ